MELKVIYDGMVNSTGKNLSQRFTGGQFLYFDALLGDNYGVELGVSLIAVLPGLNGELIKLWDDLGTLSTDELIPIPREVSESGFEFYLAFGTSSDQSLRAYVIYSEVSLESLAVQLDQVQADISLMLENQTTAFALDQAVAINALSQNTALSIIATGLIPITGGVTAPVPPLLSSSSLIGLLPPG